MKLVKGWKLSNGQGEELTVSEKDYAMLQTTIWGKHGLKSWTKTRTFILR